MSTGVAVVGGGLGGLSAAVALAGAGVPVTLFEREPRLGGYAVA
ncbi:MAG: NAD(P)-binding protein, partial [Deltaproteobacteria bacterium]|nr:NAD(P)-binding protein [Deltaproteobacteria bacterium]